MKTNIDNLFEVSYGQKKYHNKSTLEGDEGNNILISSTGDDNGIYGFYNIANNYKAPFISVPSTGTIGQAFVQFIDCSVDDNCLVLIPKSKMTNEQLLQVAFQIRLTKWKYKYGRQITPKRLKEQEVILEDININFDNMIKSSIPNEKTKHKIEENIKMELIKVKDLCSIDRKYSLYINEVSLDEEKTPYLTTTEKHNGVSIFCGEEPSFKGKCISVALDGSCGESFYQMEDFISSEKVAVLRCKSKHNPYFLFYVASQIRNNRWRYNYYRKLNLQKLRNLKLPVPIKDGNIDLDYIEKIVKNCYGYEELKEYI